MSEQEIIQNPHTPHYLPILFGYDEAEGILTIKIIALVSHFLIQLI